MPHANPNLWLAVVGLLLMIAGFFVQEATKVPLLERIIASRSAGARLGFSNLLSKSALHSRDLGFGGSLDGRPFITSADPGFGSLAALYSAKIKESAKPHEQVGAISRFVDACALVPASQGSANMVVVEWENGVKTQTSYEEIRELIAKESEASILPWQYGLFFVGLFVNIATIKYTYFPKTVTSPTPTTEARQSSNVELENPSGNKLNTSNR